MDQLLHLQLENAIECALSIFNNSIKIDEKIYFLDKKEKNGWLESIDSKSFHIPVNNIQSHYTSSWLILDTLDIQTK